MCYLEILLTLFVFFLNFGYIITMPIAKTKKMYMNVLKTERRPSDTRLSEKNGDMKEKERDMKKKPRHVRFFFYLYMWVYGYKYS